MEYASSGMSPLLPTNPMAVQVSPTTIPSLSMPEQENVKGSTQDPRVLEWQKEVSEEITTFREDRTSSILIPYQYSEYGK